MLVFKVNQFSFEVEKIKPTGGLKCELIHLYLELQAETGGTPATGGIECAFGGNLKIRYAVVKPISIRRRYIGIGGAIVIGEINIIGGAG